MDTGDFVHLRVHSEHTLLGSVIPCRALAQAAEKKNFRALALTDERTLAGAIDFYSDMVERGLRPLLGMEIHLESRRASGVPGHLLVLAMNETGYGNLVRLATLGQEVPFLTLEVVARHSSGLVALTGGLDGEVSRLLALGREADAAHTVGEYQEAFGTGHCFLELQFHQQWKDRRWANMQQKINRGLLEIGRRLNIPPVVTNDVRMLDPGDVDALHVVQALRAGCTVGELKRPYSPRHHLLRADEMWAFWGTHLPEGLRNTCRIAEMAGGLRIELGRMILPAFVPPGGQSPEAYLVELSQKGLEGRLMARGLTGAVIDRYRSRLAQELEVINRTGYAGYLLMVRDVVNYARRQGIPVGPGRGSAAGSLVVFSLGITDIDPVKYGLCFERFLNPERVSLPDIDVDFCARRRGEVLEYVVRRYGSDRVAQVGTVGTMGARTALRDVARALGFSSQEVTQTVSLVPGMQRGKACSLKQAVQDSEKLAEQSGSSEKHRKWFAVAQKLEGLARHRSVHASGVVIADRLGMLTPLFPGSSDGLGLPVTQYSMEALEKLGLVKMDFLGLKALTVLEEALRQVELETGRRIDWETVPLDDAATLALFQRGETEGIFQFESEGMTALAQEIQPRHADEIALISALYRPGPLDSGLVADYVRRRRAAEAGRTDAGAGGAPLPGGLEKAVSGDPRLAAVIEPVLRETCGVPVFQEQIMKLMQVVAGYSLGEADLIRRAMGKKKEEELAAHRSVFMERGIARGYSREALENLWQHLEGFADYAFNKCVGGETRVALVPGGELWTVADLAMGAAGPGPWRTWSWDGSGWVVNEIEDVFPTGVQDVVEVELEDGRRLVCTVDHCFYSWADDTGWGWHPLWKILSLGQPLWGTSCPAAGETTSHIHRTVSADI